MDLGNLSNKNQGLEATKLRICLRTLRFKNTRGILTHGIWGLAHQSRGNESEWTCNVLLPSNCSGIWDKFGNYHVLRRNNAHVDGGSVRDWFELIDQEKWMNFDVHINPFPHSKHCPGTMVWYGIGTHIWDHAMGVFDIERWIGFM